MEYVCSNSGCQVCSTKPDLEWNEQNRQWIEKENKMTREEAVIKIKSIDPEIEAGKWLSFLEVLGLLKFKESIISEVKINRLTKFTDVKIQETTEGLVLWVGGSIVYKSWEKDEIKDTLVQAGYYIEMGKLVEVNHISTQRLVMIVEKLVNYIKNK